MPWLSFKTDPNLHFVLSTTFNSATNSCLHSQSECPESNRKVICDFFLSPTSTCPQENILKIYVILYRNGYHISIAKFVRNRTDFWLGTPLIKNITPVATDEYSTFVCTPFTYILSYYINANWMSVGLYIRSKDNNQNPNNDPIATLPRVFFVFLSVFEGKARYSKIAMCKIAWKWGVGG